MTPDTAIALRPARPMQQDVAQHQEHPVTPQEEPEVILRTGRVQPPVKNGSSHPVLTTIPIEVTPDRVTRSDQTTGPRVLPPHQRITPPVLIRRRPEEARFIALQRWEGTVLKVDGDTFWARLVDLRTQTADEEAELFVEDVSDSDRSLLREGAVFYWSIGYRDHVTGQRERTSTLRFRRLPQWSERERQRIVERAEAAAELLSEH